MLYVYPLIVAIPGTLVLIFALIGRPKPAR
jgi:hypothetical protein